MLSKRKRIQAIATQAKKAKKYQKKDKALVLGNNLANARTQSYHARMIYAENSSITISGAGRGTQVFASNGLFDPDITGIGHQPAGFDQIMALYEEYVVVAARIRVTLRNTTSTTYTVGVSHLETNSPLADTRVYMENGFTQYKSLGANTGGNDTEELVLYVNQRNFVKKDIFSEDNYSGNASANPGQTNFFHIWIQSDGGIATAPVQYTATIEYDAFFRRPLNVNLS